MTSRSTLAATMTISDDGIQVDYTGTSPVRRAASTCRSPTRPPTPCSVWLRDAPRCAEQCGIAGAATVTAPAGTILNALKPAPVCARHITGQMLPDVVFGCLRQMMPDRVPAEGTSCLWNITCAGGSTMARRGNYGFATTFTSNGGTGARPNSDGLSATAYPSGVKGTPVEIAEQILPLIFWRKEFRPVRRDRPDARRPRPDHRDREPDRATVRAAGGIRPDRASAARGAGRWRRRAGRCRAQVGQEDARQGLPEVPPGDRLVVLTPGGGGIGDPAERDPARLAAERKAGLVTEEGAETGARASSRTTNGRAGTQRGNRDRLSSAGVPALATLRPGLSVWFVRISDCRSGAWTTPRLPLASRSYRDRAYTRCHRDPTPAPAVELAELIGPQEPADNPKR